MYRKYDVDNISFNAMLASSSGGIRASKNGHSLAELKAIGVLGGTSARVECTR